MPIGDFFCMGLGIMKSFENHFFSTAEGRSFTCTIPMPFRKNAKIVLCNNSGKYINNLFYDINLTLEPLSDDDMYFCSEFSNIEENELEKKRFLKELYPALPLLMMTDSCTIFIKMIPNATLKAM